MTCPISPLTSSPFSLIRHGNLKATGNRSHVRLLVLCSGFVSCQLKCLKAARLIRLIPKQMFVCDHFPIVKLLYQSWFTSLTLTQTYALAFCRLPATHALQHCLLTSPSNTGCWWIIAMDKPLWTYMVVKTQVTSPLEFRAMHSFTEKLYSLETKPLAGTYQSLWSSYLGKILMPRMKYIKEQESFHPY